MLLVNLRHMSDSKDLPAIPGNPETSVDAPPAYEPIASTSGDPYCQESESAPVQLVQEPGTYTSVEATGYDVDAESPCTPPFPAPRPLSRQQRASKSDVLLPIPRPSFRRDTRSDLSLPSSSSSSSTRTSQARRWASGGDFRGSRPYSTVRLSEAPPFDKSEKRAASKSLSGTVTTQDATEIMSGFLRDLLTRQFVVEQSADTVIKGCADACRVYGLSLAAFLQEPSIEGHTPIYWAVVKCTPDPETTFTHELLRTFLTYAAPLSEATLSDIRHACLENPDQELFQWIRRSTAITPLVGAAEVLFSGVVPEDVVCVEELPGENDMFIAHLRIIMFQKRMRVLKHVGLEFIARGRLWSLQMYVATADNAHGMRHGAKPGAWVVSLALLEGSQPTWVDSGFIVCKKDGTASRAEGNTTNWLRLKSNHPLAGPPRPTTASASFKEAFSVQCLSPDSPYVQPDGALGIRLEASLKPRESQAGCTIC